MGAIKVATKICEIKAGQNNKYDSHTIYKDLRSCAGFGEEKFSLLRTKWRTKICIVWGTQIFLIQKIRQMKAVQDNKYDITKASGLVLWFLQELKKISWKLKGIKECFVKIDFHPFRLMFDIREGKEIVTNIVELALSMNGTEYIFGVQNTTQFWWHVSWQVSM